MANPVLENPFLDAVVDEIAGRLLDVDVVQGLLDRVRAQVVENAALYVEAEARLAEAHQRLLEAADAAVARLALPETEEENEELEVVLDDPELIARAEAYRELAAEAGRLLQLDGLLVQALGFLVLARVIAFAIARVPLLPRVLLAVAAAYALAYLASWGRVVPGPASLLRIAVLVLCFLLGRGPRLMLGA